ncbi:DUF4913 domain-containing protein, partial [Nonomuraea sp. NPDC049784]|uniref:DUF4913 domain-containing protein n=1 Tax=Nonomuraea sp. NPDC049784 TaxID=3154361 RepID=UPI0033EEC6BD
MTDLPEDPNDSPDPSGPQQEPLDFFFDWPTTPVPDVAGADSHEGGQPDPPPAGPVLILRLGPAEYEEELSLLQQWVEHLLIPEYLSDRIPSSTAPWCPLWWEHPEAVNRLHALWLAFQERTDPEAGGFTGPDSWHRDSLDPVLRELRAPNGPFAR